MRGHDYWARMVYVEIETSRIHCVHIVLQLDIDITVDGVKYQGSLICPSCAEICYVRSSVYMRYITDCDMLYITLFFTG